MLYCSVFCSTIGVSIVPCCVLSVFVPHCFSLRCLAASCALLLWCMCSPAAFLLWNGVGLYFLLSSLIPNHLSLRSRLFDTDSMILCLLSSFLFFVSWVFSIKNCLRFLSFAAFCLWSSMSLDVCDSSYLLFLSFGCDFGRVAMPCFSQSFMTLYLLLLCWSVGIVSHSS